MINKSLFSTSVILIVLLLCGQSCSLIHFLSVSEKSHENLKTINSYLASMSYDTNYSFQIKTDFIDSLSDKKYAINLYKLKYKTKASPVQIRMYNTEGTFIYGWEQCFGNIKKLHILDSIPFKQSYWLPVNKNLSFQQDIELFDINIYEKNRLLEVIRNYDYVIIVFWAKWAGWYSKNILKRVKNYVNKYYDKKILIITLNTSP